ncbi:hypothetical protein [Aeromonas jandaei]|jgi:hypothetical protein|uniref:hypothetical protein n=1 Tax=Aeromonas jandaei TaxID=650 RepID=UPI0029A99818|nr:hypothetical protein [Aeromonas sobria]HEH9432320.1 hypothetical protein [Aeromonas sobria]
MSNDVALLSPWVAHLSISGRCGNNSPLHLDFNRFRYFGMPQTKDIQNGKAKYAKRDDLAQSLYKAIVGHEDAELSTKTTIFTAARLHVTYCDKHGLIPLSEAAVISELQHNSTRQRRGEIKDSTETSKRSHLSTLLQWMELPVTSWLHIIPSSGRTQSVPTKGYSDSDLMQMLPLLRGLFKQLHQQFVSAPKLHLNAHKHTATMTFQWKGQQYLVSSGISKMFYAATFLLSYYTWSNSSVLYQLKRPQTVSHKLSDDWHQMPAFKRRAFKTLTVEIGNHDRLEVPKYALQFFDQLLEASRLLDPRPDGWLLPSNNNGLPVMMTGGKLSGFKSKWLARYFPMYDNQGERLWPVVQRFRATGGHLTLARKGPMYAALLLDNTPQVVKLAYSSGNPHENNQMNRDVSHTLEQAVRDRQGVSAAKQKVREAQKVEVLAYEAYVQRAMPPTRSANGSYCQTNDSDRAQRFTTRARQRGLLAEGERLSCADLLACWECRHQVLVESVSDLWCILSFRECLEESLYLHLDSQHHQKNFGQVLINISARLKLVNNKVLRQAQRKLANDGRHPLWPDAASVGVF